MYLIMLLLWIVFNGRFTWEILIWGIFICAGISYFSHRTFQYDLKKGILFSKSAVLFVKYLFKLVIEIIKSSVHTMGLILFHSNEVKPGIVRFSANLKEESSKTLLATSITLTPGTITAGLDDQEFMVHVLDAPLGKGLSDSIFVEQLTEMEERINGSI